jgi:enamine deaminase RidA (YjgF/YER057c/UK114 family)
MSITRLETTARASKIVIHNGIVYVSGQVAEDPQASIEEQTRSTLGRVDAALAEAGTDNSHLLSATIYLRDIDNHFGRLNEVWNAWVPEGHAPARACVEAHMARPGLLVEVCVVAALPATTN